MELLFLNNITALAVRQFEPALFMLTNNVLISVLDQFESVIIEGEPERAPNTKKQEAVLYVHIIYNIIYTRSVLALLAHSFVGHCRHVATIWK